MLPLVYRLIFASLLLMSQTAIAVHSTHCLDEENQHACEVCIASDLGATVSDDKESKAEIAHAKQLGSFRALVSPQFYISPYLSRAPPQ